jgi:hypothetical protein
MKYEKLRQTLSERVQGPQKGPRTLAILMVAVSLVLAVTATECSSMTPPEPNGQISIFVVSWPLTKKLVVPEAGLPNHKVTLVDPSDQTVIATELTRRDGTVLFDLPPGTYEVLGAGNPRIVYLEPAERVNLKLIIH